MKHINKKTLGTVCLGLSTFLNPFGFDILVYKLTELTNDYWHTMLVLYCIAALLFGLSYLLFKRGKTTYGNIAITAALFLNPLGFDLIVYLVTLITNNYWMTISIMYMLTSLFFGLYLYLYDINPLKSINKIIKKKKNSN